MTALGRELPQCFLLCFVSLYFLGMEFLSSNRDTVTLSWKSERRLPVTKEMSTQQTTKGTHEMLTSWYPPPAPVFVYESDSVFIIYILKKAIMTSRYKLSSGEIVNMTAPQRQHPSGNPCIDEPSLATMQRCQRTHREWFLVAAL